MNPFLRILRSIIYIPAFLLLFGWIAESVRLFDPQTGITLPAWTGPAGIIVMIPGGILVLTCIIVFIIRGKGTPAPFDPPAAFVATGPYAYVRNPMYIGGFILLAGFGLNRHSISILILVVILFIFFHLFVVLYEEPTLEKQFGKSYTDYKTNINRWIPKWKMKRTSTGRDMQ